MNILWVLGGDPVQFKIFHQKQKDTECLHSSKTDSYSAYYLTFISLFFPVNTFSYLIHKGDFLRALIAHPSRVGVYKDCKMKI